MTSNQSYEIPLKFYNSPLFEYFFQQPIVIRYSYWTGINIESFTYRLIIEVDTRCTKFIIPCHCSGQNWRAGRSIIARVDRPPLAVYLYKASINAGPRFFFWISSKFTFDERDRAIRANSSWKQGRRRTVSIYVARKYSSKCEISVAPCFCAREREREIWHRVFNQRERCGSPRALKLLDGMCDTWKNRAA